MLTKAALLCHTAVARRRYALFGCKTACALPGRVQAASRELLEEVAAAGRAAASVAEAAARGRKLQ
jgi:hypothetical protein